MSENKHTPGPWTYRKCGKHWNNEQLERIEINYGTDSECIADTVYEESNARLISAAPDLLKALKMLHQWVKADIEHFDGWTPDDFIIEAVEAAIKKAEEA